MGELITIAIAAATLVGSLNTPRVSATMTLLTDGRVLVAGGRNPQSVATAEIYDPNTRSFRFTSAPMAGGRGTPAAVRLNDGRVLITGGEFLSGPVAEIYDPASDRFMTILQPAFPHLDATLTKLPDGRVLLAGGSDFQQIPSAVVDVYDPATTTWSSGGTLAIPRWGHAAVLLPDGRVLFAGGQTTGDRADSEIFDPVAKTSVVIPGSKFSQPFAALLPDGHAVVVETISVNVLDASKPAFKRVPLSLPTVSAGMVVLDGGELLFAGGSDSMSGAASTLIYTVDTDSATLNTLGNLNVAREFPGAIRVGNSVLVAGGFVVPSGQTLSAAELISFQPRRRPSTRR